MDRHDCSASGKVALSSPSTMQDDTFEIYSPRRQLLLITLGGLAICGFGSIVFFAPPGSGPLDAGHLWAFFIAGALIVVGAVARLVWPRPAIAMDTRYITARELLLPARRFPLSDLEEVVVFRSHGSVMLGLRMAPHARRTVWSKLYRFSMGHDVDMIIPSSHLGHRFESTVEAIVRVSGAGVVRRT
jgi:hypothetical protein